MPHHADDLPEQLPAWVCKAPLVSNSAEWLTGEACGQEVMSWDAGSIDLAYVALYSMRLLLLLGWGL